MNTQVISRLVRSEVRKLASMRWFRITLAVTVVLGPISAFTNVWSAARQHDGQLGSVDSIRHILSSAALTSMTMLAIGIGALTRSTVVAIIAALAWVQFVEVSLLATLVPSIGKWLPSGADVALTHTAAHLDRLLSPAIATAVLVGWTVALTVTAARGVVERDV